MSEFQTGRYHTGDQSVAALYRRGRTRLHVTFRDDSGVRHLSEPLEHERYMAPLPYKHGTYPVSRMVRKLKEIARASGVTQAAKQELEAAAAQAD